MDRVATLRQVIADAFADVPYPGDDAIVLDATECPCDDLFAALKGRHWRDIPDAHGWFAFLTPAAQRFYLPAFLFGAIDVFTHGEGSREFLNLVPPEDAARYAREHEAYTPAQREAVRLFLEYMRDEAKSPETVKLARIALQRYWGTPEERRPRPREGLSALELQAESIQEAIRRAFADVPYPPADDTISSAPAHPDDAELARDFKGYRALEVPRDILCYHFNSIALFTPNALRYYLQAFMLAAFDCNDNLIDFTIYTLDPTSDDPSLREWQKSRFAVFRPKERQAIRAFLEYCCIKEVETDDDVARRALEAYWAHDPPPA